MQFDISNPTRISLKIASIYLGTGLLWIIVDAVILHIWGSMKNETMIGNTINESIFVILTGIILFLIVYGLTKKLNDLYSKDFKEYEKKLHNLKYNDQLTGLYNRLELSKRLNLLIQSKSESKYGLMFIDVDNFKYINDSMGHSFGDLLLIKISKRMMKISKENCTFYRLGGDEFAVLIEGNKDIKAEIVEILKKFKTNFELNNNTLFITLSTGISIYPSHGVTADDLMKNADIALYKAKATGKNGIIFYNEQMNELVSERVKIEKNLRYALGKNEFELYYQPQLDIKTNRVSGFEALIRWQNPELGFVPPLKFIDIAEDTNLIIPIGQWVIRNACLFLKRLHQENQAGLTMSVNISIIQLLQEDFVDIVLEALETANLDAKYLELEITESILMKSYDIIEDKLIFLNKKGIKIALDDFGKGYSSLNYLKHLPINTLKIDKSFIDTIASEDNNKALINIIVEIGKTMDLCVIAEGVETQEQMNYLVDCKCNKIQGYLFSEPIKEDQVFKKIIKQDKEYNTKEVIK